MGRGSSAVAHRRRLVGGPTGDNEGGRVFGKQNKIKIKIKIKWERKKKWGWRDTGKDIGESGRWGHVAGREVQWSAVKDEDGEGKKKNLRAVPVKVLGEKRKTKNKNTQRPLLGGVPAV